MNVKHLNEIFSLYTNGKFKYADIDAKSVYDNCVNKDLGSHTFEEAKAFKDYVGIDENTTEEELRAIRNTLVRYWADNMDKTDEGFKMGDQMQFFTSVIDMAIDNLPKDESINEGKKREVLSDEEYAKFLLAYMSNDPTYEEVLNMLPMINDDLFLEEIKTIKRSKLKAIYNKAVELKKQGIDESLNEKKIEFKDRVDMIESDMKDAINKIEFVVNKFKSYANKYEDVKQGNLCEEIQRVLQDTENYCSRIAKRIK